MALGQIIEAVLDLLSIPIPLKKGQTRWERMERVAAIGIWIVLLLAVVLGLRSYFGGP